MLPSFRVIRATLSAYVGKYEPSGMVGEGYIAGLVLPAGGLVWGRFVDVNPRDHTATFELDDADHTERLVSGQAYVYLDSYWGEQAEIVLDPTRVWHHQPFAPRDAVVYDRADGAVVAQAGEATDPGARLVEGGWDHEHCVVCMETIGAGGIGGGWCSTEGDWVCQSCYQDYVLPRSLAFVNAQ
ncbi:MAG: hypothetical protein AB7I50_23195 [Vicinamibacterales bacterium]